MSYAIAIAADLLVAVLLVATIATSLRLSRRMARMKADESAMRATVAELLVATGSAERAIAGLRATVSESERVLADRLGAASRHTARLSEQVSAGEAVMARLGQIAEMSRKVAPGEFARGPAEAPEGASSAELADSIGATILAAREVAARAARRLDERAA